MRNCGPPTTQSHNEARKVHMTHKVVPCNHSRVHDALRVMGDTNPKAEWEVPTRAGSPPPHPPCQPGGPE